MSKTLGLFVLALCVALGLGRQASAQLPAPVALALSNGTYGSLSFDGLTITATTCEYSDPSTRAKACGSTGLNELLMVPSTNPRDVADVTIEAANNAPILSYTCSTSTCPAGTYDLSLTLTVTTNNSAATLTGASVAMTGSASPSSLDSDVSGGEPVLSASNATLCQLYVSLSAPTEACPTFAGQNYLSVEKDFSLSLNSVANGTTLQLTSITESFSPVPEPTSIATLLGGLVALAVARGKLRRT